MRLESKCGGVARSVCSVYVTRRTCECFSFKIQIAFHTSDTTRAHQKAQDKPTHLCLLTPCVSTPLTLFAPPSAHILTQRSHLVVTVPSYSGCSLHVHCGKHAANPPQSPAEDLAQIIMKPAYQSLGLDLFANSYPEDLRLSLISPARTARAASTRGSL